MCSPHESVRTVYLVADLPPPVGGKSVINARLLDLLRERCSVTAVNVSPKRLGRGLDYHLSRAWRSLKGSVFLAFRLRRGDRVIVSLDAGLGLAYNLLFLIVCTSRGQLTYLYHHSFSYIDRSSPLMRLVAFFGRRLSTHIFLCEEMRDKFLARYSTACKTPFVLSNHAYLSEAKPDPEWPKRAAITVALLAHLSRDKGVDVFLKFVQTAREVGLPVKGILAGPFANQSAELEFGPALERMKESITYFGSVYGERKKAFLRQADVFLFPTRFRVEAQPVVLLEAAAHGIPIISWGRGCIGADWAGAAVVIPQSEDFVSTAIAVVSRWSSHPADYSEAAVRSRHRFNLSKRLADRQMDAFLSAVCT